MRPCPRCGTAIGNKAATCKECVGKPRDNILAPCRTVSHLPDALPDDDADSDDLTMVFAAVATVFSMPLALCYLAFGAAGLAAGTLVGLSLFVVFWSAVGGC